MTTNRVILLESVVDTFLLHSDNRRKLLRNLNKRLKQDGEDVVEPQEVFEFLFPKLSTFVKQRGYLISDKVTISNLLINYWFIHPSYPTIKYYFRDLVRLAFQSNVYLPNDCFIHTGTKVSYNLTLMLPTLSRYSPVANSTILLASGDTLDDVPMYPYFFDMLREV